MSKLTLLFVLVVSIILCSDATKHSARYKVKSLDQCGHDVAPIGCASHSDDDRKKSDLILTGRDVHSKCYNDKEHTHVNDDLWTDYEEWLPNFICQCTNELFKKNPGSQSFYIGIGYYAECWSISKEHFNGIKDFSRQCIKTNFHKLIPLQSKIGKCSSFSGQDGTLFVYKVTKQQYSCKQFYVQRKCKKAELDETNGVKPKGIQKIINLKNDNKLHCTCSEEAVKAGYRFFSVDHLSRCMIWDESVMELKSSDHCYHSNTNGLKAQCTKGRSSCKSSTACNGLTQNDHQIYEAVQGAFECEKNPCKNNGVCSSNRPFSFECKCPHGFSGKHCETVDETDDDEDCDSDDE